MRQVHHKTLKGRRYQPLTHEQHERLELGIVATRSGSEFRLRITANLNGLNAGVVQQRVEQELASGATSVVLDLTRCDRIDRNGLGALVEVLAAARVNGAAFSIVGARGSVRAEIARYGLAKVLSDLSDLESAAPRGEP